MNHQEKNKHEDGQGIDLQNSTRAQQAHVDPEEAQINTNHQHEDIEVDTEDTMREMISTHEDNAQEEGVDEQFGGDKADNRDDDNGL
ncbi:MAG: hypothetical protein ACO1N4_08595 [Pedobacter sp.]